MNRSFRVRTISLLLCGGVTAIASGCLSRAHTKPAPIDDRDVAVYRMLADSLYVRQAAGRRIALINRTLDTACASSRCTPIEKRWGLDSLSSAPENTEIARELRQSLLSRAARPQEWGAERAADSNVVGLALSDSPGPDASAEAWSAFQRSTAAATLQFSPVGFSQDGAAALVVVRMRCGPRCGHLLVASLLSRQGAWNVKELLLVTSEK